MKESLVLIRHGRSEQQVHRSTSWESNLTEFGKLQSRAVGRFLDKPWPERRTSFAYDHIFYVSPFLRCLETVRYMLQEMKVKLKQPPIVLPSLSEFVPDIVHIVPRYREFPEFNWYWFRQAREFIPEKNEEFLERMLEAYEYLKQSSVVITHGFPAHMLALIAMNQNVDYVPCWDWSLDNCSITWIDSGRKKWWGRNIYTEEVMQLQVKNEEIVVDSSFDIDGMSPDTSEV
jgi:broad specificity phosphatase PhoE